MVAKSVKRLELGLDPGAEKINARRALRDAESFEELAFQWVERWAKPNRKSWRAAQREPERHGDLIVKVGGYSTYFVDLGREIQREVIDRTEHGGM